MYVNKKICLLLVEFLMIVVCNAEHAHPDKKSFDTRNDYKADNENSCEKELRECRDVSDEILSRRIVNMLLSRIKLTEEDSWFNGRVELEGVASELETLRNFGLGISTVQGVAPILEDVIKTTEFGGVYECGLCLQSLQSQLFNFIDTYKQHIPSIVLGLYLIRTLRAKKSNLQKIISLGVVCICGVIFADTLPDTLREVEQEVNTKEAPIHCRPDEMSWTDKIMALFVSAKDSEKYEEEMNYRPGTILELMSFRILYRIRGQIIAQSINIGFAIIKFSATILLGLILLIIALLTECSMTIIVALMLVLYGVYVYRSICIRRLKLTDSHNSAIHAEEFSANPKRSRNQRRKKNKNAIVKIEEKRGRVNERYENKNSDGKRRKAEDNVTTLKLKTNSMKLKKPKRKTKTRSKTGAK